MSVAEWAGLLATLLVMLMGVAGSVLPAIPGPPLVLAAAVAHKLIFGPAGASLTALVAMGLLMLLSLAFDFAASLIGARKLGATWRGVAGAAVGAVAGLFLGPVALVLGPFVGAVLGELLGGREFKEAGRAGVGAVLGFLAGALGKVACALAMTGLFLLSVLLH